MIEHSLRTDLDAQVQFASNMAKSMVTLLGYATLLQQNRGNAVVQNFRVGQT